MNIILFEHGELPGLLRPDDPRAIHLLEILKLAPGDRFLAGLVGGPHGSACLEHISERGLQVGGEDLTTQPKPLSHVRILVGTPRPPTARRLLKDLTTMGVSEIHFVATTLGDRNYLQSKLWVTDWREALKEGAAQNRSTLLPTVERHERLGRWLEDHVARGVRFDAEGAPWNEHVLVRSETPLWLAVGPERGWTDEERARFDHAGWSVASLGPSVLRTETACTLAVGLVRLFETTRPPS